jgi:RNA recognition motif-containing protein
VLKNPNHIIDGKVVECKIATPKENANEIKPFNYGCPQQYVSGKEDTSINQAKKIFVGGLSTLTNEDSLKAYFENFGKVEKVQIMKDKTSGRSRGFGFIIFEKSEAVDAVIDYPQHILHGKAVDCKRSFPKEGKELMQPATTTTPTMSSKSINMGKESNPGNPHFNQQYFQMQNQDYYYQQYKQHTENPSNYNVMGYHPIIQNNFCKSNKY